MGTIVEGAPNFPSEIISSVQTTECPSTPSRGARSIRYEWVGQVILQKWINAYGNNYAAHTVWRGNVSALMKSGIVKPGEMQLAYEGKVNPQMYWYIEEKVKGFDFEELKKVKNEWREREEYSRVQSIFLHCSINAFKVVAHLNVEVNRQALCSLTPKERLKIKETYIRKYSPPPCIQELMCVDLPFCRDDITSKFQDRPEKIKLTEHLMKRLGVSKYVARLLIDKHFVVQSIDQRLAEIYDKTHGEVIFRTEDFDYSTIRAFDIPVEHTVSASIYALYNMIDWRHDGSIAILIGAPQVESIYNCPCERGLYVSFLPPWKNQGNYYTISLHDSNVIIMGPGSILNKYKKIYRHIVTFEEMSLEQKCFFDVDVQYRNQSIKCETIPEHAVLK